MYSHDKFNSFLVINSNLIKNEVRSISIIYSILYYLLKILKIL